MHYATKQRKSLDKSYATMLLICSMFCYKIKSKYSFKKIIKDAILVKCILTSCNDCRRLSIKLLTSI